MKETHEMFYGSFCFVVSIWFSWWSHRILCLCGCVDGRMCVCVSVGCVNVFVRWEDEIIEFMISNKLLLYLQWMKHEIEFRCIARRRMMNLPGRNRCHWYPICRFHILWALFCTSPFDIWIVIGAIHVSPIASHRSIGMHLPVNHSWCLSFDSNRLWFAAKVQRMLPIVSDRRPLILASVYWSPHRPCLSASIPNDPSVHHNSSPKCASIAMKWCARILAYPKHHIVQQSLHFQHLVAANSLSRMQ